MAKEIKNAADLEAEIKDLFVDEVKEDKEVEVKDAVLEVKADEAMNTNTEAAATTQVEYSNTLIEKFDAFDKVDGLGKTYSMAAQVQKIPHNIGWLKFYKNLENRDVPGFDAKTSKSGYVDIELVARKISTSVYLTREFVESARFNVEKDVMNDIAKGLVNTASDVIINGDTATDTTNVNSTGVAPTGDEAYLNADGLRKSAIANNTLIDGWVIDFKKILAAKAKLRDKGLNPQDLTLICDIDTYSKLLEMPEFTTVEKFGTEAVVKSGVLGRIAGMNVKVSDIPLTNADGVVDASDPSQNTKGTLLIVNNNGILKGLYSNTIIKTQYLARKDQYETVCHANLAITILAGFVAGIKNIDLS